MAINFDKTVQKLCRKKLTSPDEPLLQGSFTPTEAIAEALIRRALSGNADALKLVRDILGKQTPKEDSRFFIDINVVE